MKRVVRKQAGSKGKAGTFLLLRDVLSGLCFQSQFSETNIWMVAICECNNRGGAVNDGSVSSASHLKGWRVTWQVMQRAGQGQEQGWWGGGRC